MTLKRNKAIDYICLMKNNLMRAAVFIVLGIALFVVSAYTKNTTTEKWSSFIMGLSFPMFVGAVISVVKYFKEPKQTPAN